MINNQATFVANREVLDAIPTTRRDTTARALLIPGTTVTPFVLGQYNLTSHGSSTSDFTMAIDGLRVNNLCGSGQYSGFYMNDAAVQELTYSTGSESAEIQSSGIRVNSVPKDGGNRFSGSFFLYGQGSSLQSDNRTDAMKAVQPNGLPLITIAGTAYDWQINPSFGGPLAKDKLWFYVDLQVPGRTRSTCPSSHFADGSPAFRKLAWATTAASAASPGRRRARTRSASTSRSSSTASSTTGSTPTRRRRPRRRPTPSAMDGSRRPGGRARNRTSCCSKPASPTTTSPTSRTAGPSVKPTDLPNLNGSTGLLTGSLRLHDSAVFEHDQGLQRDGVGQLRHRLARDEVRHHRPLGRELADVRADANIDTLIKINVAGLGNDIPFQVVVYNSPATSIQNVNSDFGSYAQDTWTMKRLTLNYGARFEHFNASVPAESSPASTWIGARNFPAIPDVPNWNDWAVRLAAAYDLFGNGKTAHQGATPASTWPRRRPAMRRRSTA